VGGGTVESVNAGGGRAGEKWPGRVSGVLTSGELAAAGIRRARLRTLLNRGEIVPLGHGVYTTARYVQRAESTTGGTDVLRIAAAAAVTGTEAVASFHSAAMIYGLDLLRPQPADVAVTRDLGAAGCRTGRPGVQLHVAALPPEHRAKRLGVPVTSVARTVIDMARSVPFRNGVVAADSALRRKLTTKAELQAVVEACSGWPGIAQARLVVEFSDALSESAFESISRVVFRDGGLPPPELQVWVGREGLVIGRVDFLWRKFSTIAEADGAAKYSDPDRARRQLSRDADLREAGFEVVHFGWQDVHLNAHHVVGSIRAAFARNAALRTAERPQKRA
jgi:hypothetical protein